MNKIINKIKRKLRKFYFYFCCLKIKRPKSNKVLVLVGTPNTANLGDHLITEAETQFFNIFFKNYDIMELTGDIMLNSVNYIKNKIHKEDIIFITGGGFLGNLWMTEENMVRNTISNFHENKIFILPQTIYFDKNEEGIREFEISKKIYLSHPNLHIFSREKYSYDYLKNKILFPQERLRLTPDIALYLRYDLNIKRNKIILCFRNDKEKIINNYDFNNFSLIAEKYNLEIEYTDTVIDVNVKSIKRKEFLNKKIKQFSSAKIVITDRLHGMIFAAITGTPCIALNNKTGKVKGVFEWIKTLNYVFCIDDLDLIPKMMSKVIESDELFKYDLDLLKNEFIKMNTYISSILGMED